MKTARRLMLVLLFCIALMVGVHSVAYAETIASGVCGAEGDNLTWTLYDNYELVIEGSGDMENYNHTLPPWVNYRSQIMDLTIRSGVTGIGDWAFSSISGLARVTIPDSVINIGYAAFRYCGNLTEIQVESGNAVYCSLDGVLYSADLRTLFLYPEGKSGVLTIPASVSNIELEDSKNGITAFQIAEGNASFRAVDGLLYTADMKMLLRCPGAKTGNIIIPQGVIYLDWRSFRFCSGRITVTIPDGVETIPSSSFFTCTGLTGITFPNSLITIGEAAFQHCHSLTSVTIPYNVTNIGDAAFSMCYSLQDFSVDSQNPVYCAVDGAIYTADTETLICYPCGRSGSLTIPDGVTRIGNDAFYGNQLTNVVIPDGVTEIGWGAFTVSSLKTVTIPASVTWIDDFAFNCYDLTDVFYGGTEEQWNAIEKEAEGNDPLFSAAIHYNAQTLTINYDANGGEGVMDPQILAKGEKQTLNANTFTHANLIFTGWNTKSDGSGVTYANRAEITPEKDMTLYAQWAEKVKVTYNPNGGSPESPRRVQYLPKDIPAKIATMEKIGYTRTCYEFIGWSPIPEIDPNDPRIIPDGGEVCFDEDTILYAQWLKTRVKVSLDPNGGDGTRKAQLIPIGVSAKLASIEKVGYSREDYIFIGWSPISEVDPSDPRIIPNCGEVCYEDDTTLYAIWRHATWIPINYTISQESNGSGIIQMKNGDQVLTSNSVIRDDNGNIIIKGNGSNTWLVEENAETDLSMTVKTSTNSGAYVSLNNGAYIAFTGERSFNLGQVIQQMEYTVVFINGRTSPRTDVLLKLPASLTSVEDEAFAGGAFTEIVVPIQVGEIGPRAFAGCPNLESVFILGETTEIAQNAFEHVEGVTIYCKFNSKAMNFAKENGFNYKLFYEFS